MILKAPEETPASPAELVRCFADAAMAPCTTTANLLYAANPVVVKKTTKKK